jgi:hypothetical protein
MFELAGVSGYPLSEWPLSAQASGYRGSARGTFDREPPRIGCVCGWIRVIGLPTQG